MADAPGPSRSGDPPFPVVERREERVIEHRSVRQRRGRGKARITINLTTMIDVVFLLLVYFMVATEFKLGEEVYRLDLPKHLQSTQRSDPYELPEEPLIVEVTSSGPASTRYDINIEGPYRSPETFDELYDFLRDRQINDLGTARQPMFFPDHPIIIRPARTATWDHTIAAFNAAARARYTNIRFARAE